MQGVSGAAAVVVMLLAATTLVLADYIQKSILCDDIAAICEHNGIDNQKNATECGENQEKFLNPEVCNCGSTCISNLGEGEFCYTSFATKYPTELCGPGLECIISDPNNPDLAVCTRNPARQCINETLQYEDDQAAGTLGPGQYKPNCDQYGKYTPRQCTPGGTCYCVNIKGERLPGEGSIFKQNNISCACSVHWEEMKTMGLNLGMRCLPNGNFDPLQCLDNKCFCYDEVTSTVSYGPFSFDMIENIPCYDPTIHNKEYINPCHKALEEWNNQDTNDTIVVRETLQPICTPDGYYAAVQYGGKDAYCADLHGNQIENFRQPITTAQNMNCHCARRRLIMEENDMGSSKPKCCPNGDFYPWQTRGLFAYCVDGNGNQIGVETAFTDIQGLSCYSDQPCDTSVMYSS
ncbi:uncharacterized protein [Procambarus clarkii]|uniref:uncharacterized protein n=1 Tax=Procambarus clarkii TaxID=6728 RepID=UPI003742835A